MPRRVYLLGVGLALVALAFAVTDLALSLQPGVTEVNVKRIRRGMTLSEVEALFGANGRLCFKRGRCARRTSVYEWTGGGGEAVAVFGPDGGAESALFRRDPHLSPLVRLRAWLGW